jgi:Protein of unknown function (DUF3060)
MRAVFFAFLSIGAIASATQTGLAQSATAPDGEMVTRNLVASNNQTLTLDGDGKPKIIAGNNNKIRIRGDCSSLKVLGNSNSVEVEQVGTIQMVGNSNRVFYVHALGQEKPTVANLGNDNETSQVPALGSPSPSPSVQAMAQTTGEDVQVIMLANDTSTQNVQKPHVRLLGSNNSLVFTGVAQVLEIEGSNNDIEIDRVDKVIFHGSNNDVSYKQDPTSGEVVSESRGSNNDVEKQD